MNFIMTTDVECYSFETNSFDYENVPKKILTVALLGLRPLAVHFDGGWNYSIDLKTGEEREQIDFHQGYVLESIYEIQNAGAHGHL